MRETLLKVGQDLKHNRQIESYLTAFLTLAFTLLSFFGDVVSADLRWAACTMGIGLLVARSGTAHEVAPHSTAEKAPLDVQIRYVFPVISHRDADIIVEMRPRNGEPAPLNVASRH